MKQATPAGSLFCITLATPTSPTPMVSSSKAPPKPVAKASKSNARPAPSPAAGKASKPPANTAPDKASHANEPSLRFYHSQALRSKTDALMAALQAGPDPAVHGPALADLVTELTEAGMDYYYLRALKQAKVGFVAEQSARLGMSGAVKLISSVSRKFIERMDHAQLLIVAQHLRSLT